MKNTIIKIFLTILLGILPITISINIYAENNITWHRFDNNPISEIFPDENLARAVAYHLNNNEDTSAIVTEVMLERIESLNVSGRNILSLDGMEYLVNLTHFNASHNQIIDLRPLSNLTQLKALNLSYNIIQDINVLGGLSSLNNLDLGGNKIADISIVSNMSSLLNLNLSNNKISDVNALRKLILLRDVNLKSNQIKNVEPLKNLEALTYLVLSNNQISDISSLHRIYSNANTFSVQDQTILLPKVAINTLTNFTLLNHEGITPKYDFTVGSGQYNAANGELLWTTTGENRMVWSEHYNFTGVVIQNAIETSTISTISEIFPDQNLAKHIAMAVNQNDDIHVTVTTEELSTITDLLIVGGNIKDLTGMEYLINMVYLIIKENQVSDLKPLTKLVNMRYLELSSNQIKDISPLSELHGLRNLDLSNNQITDVRPIENSLELRFLFIDNNHIIDISFLSNVYESVSFFSAINQIVHLPQVETSIRTDFPLLNQHKSVPQLSFIEGQGSYINGQLTWNTAGQNQLKWTGPDNFTGTVVQNVIPGAPLTFIDIFPDENLAREIAFRVTGNEDTSAVVALEELENMQVLALRGPDIQYLWGMEYLTGLRYFICENNQIVDLSPLCNMNQLYYLYLGGNQIECLEPIKNLADLKYLSLANNQISDISPILGLHNITHLSLQNNHISDINGIQNLTRLQDLKIHDNHISDVNHLENIRGLQFLNLDNNHISDISSLNHLVHTARHFSVLNQTIYLPEATIGQITQFTLLNEDGIQPTTTITVGIGIVADGMLAWISLGVNEVVWNDSDHFSGTIYQTIR